MKSLVPVNIITGFLGVGKTTSILNILEKLKDKEYIAVLVNERGEVGLDGAIIGSSGKALPIREVTGGCICCTAGPLLLQALEDILNNVGPDRIIIEPSGIANPGIILDLINTSSCRVKIELGPIITLVDPVSFIETKMWRLPIFRDQVEAADILVANRCDLVDELTLDKFCRKGEELFPPKIKILTTSFGKFPEEILSSRSKPHRVLRQSSHSIDNPENGNPTDPRHIMFHDNGWTWEPATTFSHNSLFEAFDAFRSRALNIEGVVERAKGVFHTDKGWYLMELAFDTFSEREVQYRSDNRCQIITTENSERNISLLYNLFESCIIEESLKN